MPDLHHYTIFRFPSRISMWIDFNLERSQLERNVEFLHKPAWRDTHVSEILFFQVKMEESEAWIILTSKHDDSIDYCDELIILSNVPLFLWFHKHCILSLGQTPTDVFEDSISSTEYLAIWRKTKSLLQISHPYKCFLRFNGNVAPCQLVPLKWSPTKPSSITKDVLRIQKLSKNTIISFHNSSECAQRQETTREFD